MALGLYVRYSINENAYAARLFINYASYNSNRLHLLIAS